MFKHQREKLMKKVLLAVALVFAPMAMLTGCACGGDVEYSGK